jgi:hypothetical protein
MKCFVFDLHYYNCFVYILIRSISFSIREINRVENKDIFNNQYISLLLMYIGEIFSIFFYIYEKNTSKKIHQNNVIKLKLKRVDSEKENWLNKHKIKIFFFICGLLDFIYSINYQYYYSYQLKKISDIFENADRIFFIFIVCLFENFYLNIHLYIHHYLGLFLSVISLIILIFSDFSELNEFSFSLSIIIMIIYLEIACFDAFQVLIEKKLNTDYYVNVYYICFIEGIYGICFLLIFYLLTYEGDYLSLFKIKNVKTNLFFYFLEIISSCSYNLCRLKISEKNRPSYNIIGDLICILLYNIYKSIFKNLIWTQKLIFPTFFSLLGSLIFCEVITFNFWNLDKYTFYRTSIRADLELSTILYENNSEISDLEKDF